MTAQIMLSDTSIEKIKALTFDPQAKVVSCLLPLASIFWDDELPARKFLEFPEPDREAVMRVFSIRINLWNGDPIEPGGREMWDDFRRQFPNWPGFQRLTLSEEARAAHEEVQRGGEAFFTELFSAADEASVSPNNELISYQATFRLNKEPRKWWQFWK